MAKNPNSNINTGEIVVSGGSDQYGLASGGVFEQSLAPAGPSTGSTGPRGFQLRDLLRYKWTIVLVFLLVAIPSVIGIWTLVVPRYRAAAEIQVRPIIPRVVFNTENNGLIPLYRPYLNTQVSVIRSPKVLQRVLDREDVQATRWYQGSSGSPLSLKPPAPPLERLRKALHVGPRPQTEVIDVSMSSVYPNDASVVVNAVLEEYIKFVSDRSGQTDKDVYATLTERYSSLRSKIEGHERITETLRKELGTGTPAELINQRRMRLDQLEAQLDELTRQIALAEWQRDHLKKARTEARASAPAAATAETTGSEPDPEATLDDQARYEADPEWHRLYVDLKRIDNEIATAGDHFGPSHPRIVALNRQKALTEDLLTMREGQLRQQWQMGPTMASAAPGTADTTATTGTMNIETLERHIGLLKYQRELVMKSLTQRQSEFDEAFDRAQMLEKEAGLVRHTRQLYDAVRERLDQKEMERNVPGSIHILAEAISSSRPHRDRRALLTAMALCGALGLGLAVAFLRANVSATIHEPRDVAELSQTPFLGQLPLWRQESDHAIEDDPMQSEHIRMIRTALLRRLDGEMGHAVLITSATPGTGKTTVSMLLARSLAQCGKNVLLVDADLRNPMISSRLAVDRDPGLMGTLTDRAGDGEAIVPTGVERLSVLPAGTMSEGNDAELLANGRFSASLNRWRSAYDVVIIDSPPVLPVADARILSRHADGTVMVVREDYSTRDDLVDSLAYLSTAGGRLLGTVFIGEQRGRDYSKSGYCYGYYGATERVEDPEESADASRA